MPGPNPRLVVDDDELDDLEHEEGKRLLQKESVRQAWFQSEANDVLQVPNGYLKVTVLIIRWDESIDEFKGHEQEVSQ